MFVTKLEHSGAIVELNGKKLVFDPVEFAATLPELRDVVAIVITHGHSDHLQPEKIAAIRDLNPEAKVFVPEDVVATLPDAIVVKGGEEVEVEGFKLQFFGKDHAEVVEGKVPCQNVGVVVNGRLENPGDSFDLLNVDDPHDVLLVPEVAPWCKMAETMEFMRIAKPKMVIPVHDGLLSPMGKTIYDNLLRMTAEEIGAEFAPLGVGETVEI